MKKKIILPILVTVSLSIPTFLPLLSCSNGEQKKDPRDETDDPNIVSVQIPTISLNKSFSIRVVLNNGFTVDGDNTRITIGEYTLSYANRDFEIEEQNNVFVYIHVNAQKVISSNIVTKIVSKSKVGPQPVMRSVSFRTTEHGTLSGDTYVNVTDGTFWQDVPKPRPVPQDEHYKFDKWVDSNTGREMAITDVINSNMVINAIFVIKKVTITFEATTGGSIQQPPIVVDHGTKWRDIEKDLRYTTDTGYKFLGWYNKATDEQIEPDDTVENNMTALAKFAKISPTPQDCFTFTINDVLPPYAIVTGFNSSTIPHDNVVIPSIYKKNGEEYPVVELYDRSFKNLNTEYVLIPSKVTKISKYAFMGCKANTICFDNNSELNVIDEGAFYQCQNLKNITVPEGITIIDSVVFFECSQLSSVNISSKVLTTIKSNAFHSCTSLTEINFPQSLTKIESTAFYDCKNLVKINYEGTIDQWKQVDREDGWHEGVPTTAIVHCTDGDCGLDEN